MSLEFRFRPIADIQHSATVGMMDRRTLLALAATLPAMVPTAAAACSFALKSPPVAGLANQQVRELFEAWWGRDSAKFQALFTNTLMDDGRAMEPKLARELRATDPVPKEAFSIFERFFIDQRTLKRISLIVNTDAGVFVACSEANPLQEIGADCSGTPKLHLFLVTMSGLNPRSVEHLASAQTPEPGKFSIWTEGA